MPRRKSPLPLAFAFALAMSGASTGVGAVALSPQPVVVEEAAPAPAPDVAHIDPLPTVGQVTLSAAPAPQPPPGRDISAVQQRLTELGYYVGPIDGKRGPATRSAVMAFQKVNGLSVDGVVGPQTAGALANPAQPALRGGPPHRVEVDLTKQVLYYVEGDQLTRIMPVSSGNGARYRTDSGRWARGLTPVGDFEVERHIHGLRKADLGDLYDPMYFHGGYAIHGSNSVPARPASHGCIRVPRADALWLFDRLPVGSTVMVYGGTYTFSA